MRSGLSLFLERMDVMSEDAKKTICPHCSSGLKPFRLPDQGGWNNEIHYACFNNDCPYFQRGWTWMMEQYEAKASYRYRIDPKTGAASPLAVWSETAMLDRIVDSEE